MRLARRGRPPLTRPHGECWGLETGWHPLNEHPRNQLPALPANGRVWRATPGPRPATTLRGGADPDANRRRAAATCSTLLGATDSLDQSARLPKVVMTQLAQITREALKQLAPPRDSHGVLNRGINGGFQDGRVFARGVASGNCFMGCHFLVI